MTASNDGGNGARSRGPFGPLEMLDEVQRQAFDAAMRVASELSALTGDLANASWLGDAFGGAARTEDAPPDSRRARSERGERCPATARCRSTAH